MKILLISPYFPPEVGSAAHLYGDLARALKVRGHQVAVLTGLARYHVVGRSRQQRRRPVVYESYHGLAVYRAFNLDIPWDVPLLRGVDQFLSAVASGLVGLLLPAFDIALVYSPPLPLALAAWGLCRFRRRPLVVNLQDLFPQSAIDLGMVRNPWLVRLFTGLESFLYHRADRLMVHSEGNRRYLAQRGARPERIAVIPNWVDTEAIKPAPRQNPLRRRLGLNQHFIVSFAGIMGYSQGLETVLESARLLKDRKDILFLLVGDGVEKPRLQGLAKDQGLDQVQFLPMQAKEEYPQVLAASDLCLVTLRQEVRTPVVPSKILSIMAAGRPVLASLPLTGDAPGLIAAAECGLCLPPGEPAALARAILACYRDADLREKMGRHGRAYARRHLSLKACAAQVEGLLEQTCAAAASECGVTPPVPS
jgi:colanic acid biosynthesis glycosyl transferase WcaI